jgi:hypothetical protein
MTSTQDALTKLRPFYFSVVFWGETHRNYFRDLLLSSLLAPGNIPALDRRRGSKFLIVTTTTDWAALQTDPLFIELSSYVEPVHIEMTAPQPEDNKMRVMSAGHKIIATRCHDDRAYGLWLSPDVIFGDGAIRRLEELVMQGIRVVLGVAIRFETDGVCAELTKKGYMRPGRPLTVPSADLMAAGLRNIHSETRRYEFRSAWFADQPISVYWWLPDCSGFVIYSFSWCPFIIDYAMIEDHDTSTFDEWTLDGDYLHRNLRESRDIYILRDSDELGFISLTKESELHFDLVPERLKGRGILSFLHKTELIRNLWESPVMDPLKRDIFDTPVFFHSGPISPKSQEFCEETKRIIQTAIGTKRFTFKGMAAIQMKVELVVSRVAMTIIRSITETERTLRWYVRYRRFVWRLALWKLKISSERPMSWDSPIWLEPRSARSETCSQDKGAP